MDTNFLDLSGIAHDAGLPCTAEHFGTLDYGADVRRAPEEELGSAAPKHVAMRK